MTSLPSRLRSTPFDKHRLSTTCLATTSLAITLRYSPQVMVLGLLAITAIPTVIGIAEGVSAQKRQNENRTSDKLLRKFTLDCYCEGKHRINGGTVVLVDNKVWIQSSPRSGANVGNDKAHPFQGFYVQYPDDQRPQPLPLGLVSTISDDPPMLNWIYVDKTTLEVKYGNRTQSRAHRVGSWGWTGKESDNGEISYDRKTAKKEEVEEEEEEPGGLTFEGEEKFVAVEPLGGGDMWELMWDEKDDLLRGLEGIKGRKVLQISLERTLVEEVKGEDK